MNTPVLQNRIALITGASRGIGAAIAKRFAQEGAQVIITARTLSGLEQVDDEIRAYGKKALIVPLDLQDAPKIDMLSVEIAQRFGKLDILVGNAGILGGLTPTSHFTPSLWEQVINVNLTANWRLIRNFDRLLQQSDAGRALFVTSGVTQFFPAYYSAYSSSKAGLEALVTTYAQEVKHTKLKVNLIDPGIVRTQLRAEAMPGENPELHPEPTTITDDFVLLASVNCPYHGQCIKVKP